MNKIYSAIFILLMLTACLDETKNPPTSTIEQGNTVIMDSNENTTQQGGIHWRNGTVVYLDLEGGFYGIVDENNEKLLPLNLAPEFKKEGTIIKFKGAVENDIVSIQQWGTAFTISDIELVKIGKDSNNLEY